MRNFALTRSIEVPSYTESTRPIKGWKPDRASHSRDNLAPRSNQRMRMLIKTVTGDGVGSNSSV
jgi:hypothetical protein